MNRISQVLGLSGMAFGPLGMAVGIRAGEVAGNAALCVRDTVISAPYVATVGLKALIEGKSFRRAWIEEFRSPESQSILDQFEREMAELRGAR